MNIHSIRFRLIALVAGLFLLSHTLILVLLSHELVDLADHSQRMQVEERLEVILSELQASEERLRQTLQVEAYEAGFKRSAAERFEQSYYGGRSDPYEGGGSYAESEARPFPMIIDRDAVVVAHPLLARGSEALREETFAAQALDIRDGDFVAQDAAGGETWYVTRRFAPWDWQVIYRMPLAVKYADVKQIEITLLWIKLVIGVVAIGLIFWTVSRLTRPIVELSGKTKEIASGRWSRRIEIERRDEVGLLAENFNLMQDAIQAKLSEQTQNMHSLEAEVAQRKAAEERLKRSEARLHLAADSARLGVFDFDLQANALRWDARMFEIYGLEPESFSGGFETWRRMVHPEDEPRALGEVEAAIASQGEFHMEFRIVTPGGELRHVEAHGGVLSDAEGQATNLVGVNMDVTERKITEEVVKRTHKMEAMGQITGGVAHDFNNILGVILGNLEILQPKLEGDPDGSKRLQAALRSTLRAADLTKRILGFSRAEAKDSTPTDINATIRGMTTILSKSVTPEVEIELHLVEDLWNTDIDSGDFEDALLNLALNARDAMEGRGRLVIETSNRTLGDHYCRMNPGVAPGDYVQLAISDSGRGIPQKIMDRIFDPFFTTKPEGQGTGLGLSMVFGFANRSRGHVKAYSEAGVGTTFRLYLPRSLAGEAGEQPPRPEAGVLPRGSETILVVDDEEDLLEVAQTYLTGLGYTTVLAGNAREAMTLLGSDTPIDALFSDVVMPGGVNGYELAAEATRIRPDLKVLLTSGFTSRAMAREGETSPGVELLIKPYNEAELAGRLRILLDA